MRNISEKIVEKITTHKLCSVTFFPRKSCRLWDDLEIHGRGREATDDYYNRAHVRYMLDN